MGELRDIAVKYAHLMWVSDYRKLLNTADEIERLEKRHDNFLKEFYATNAENAELQSRIKELEGVIRSQIDAWPELYAAIAATEQGEKDVLDMHSL